MFPVTLLVIKKNIAKQKKMEIHTSVTSKMITSVFVYLS